ncbi:MAG: hypothetical protein FWF52_01100 [Candidatus Azobacteroides sp.]|nr:hypothetical protein [Candidatus Azobacteroides sp.]
MILYFNQTEMDLPVNDESYRYRAIKGEHSLTLYYSLPQHVEIPLGAYCVFEGETYMLESPENFKKHNTRNFEYTLILESAQAKLSKYKFRDTVTRRLKFPLTAKPQVHLQMLIDNLNRREEGWKVGRCIEAVEKVLSYNHAFCRDALSQMAEAFETEWEISGKTIHLCKVEYNKGNPLKLSYGRGNGFKSGIGRSNTNNTRPVEILFVQGGERNIDASRYGSPELLLPKEAGIGFDGAHFSDQEGFDSSQARWYATDADGFSLRRSDKPLSTQAEDSLDCPHIYPSRIGKISAVKIADAEKHFYDIIDNSIPQDFDYEKYLIGGEKMTIIFQSGMLAGKEFEVKYIHTGRRFEIVPQEIDGRMMPDDIFCPQVDQEYAVFGMMLPQEYICNNETKTGASWDMFREAVRYLYENEEPKFTFTGELDGIWAKKDWLNIGGRIRLGGYVLFHDDQFQPDGVLIRMVGIKDYINNSHSPQIELSNEIVGNSISSSLRKIETNEVIVNELHKDALQFAKRRFRDSLETVDMLKDSLLNFSEAVNPVAVQTMMALIGDESLQFRFVNNKTNPVEVPHHVKYDPETKTLFCPGGIIQHMTLGISSISSSHEYKFWELGGYPSPPLTEPEKKFYLYAKASKSADTGEFYLSDKAVKIDQEEGYYTLLVGILNSEFEGERSYIDLYGFTEILPGRITTERIVSSDGQNFMDFLNNAFRVGDVEDKTSLSFNTNGDGKLILKGTLVQSQSGGLQPIGVFRGEYNPAYPYYSSDEVTYQGSTYRYIYDAPQSGKLPTDGTYWTVTASKGTNGTNGINGQDGADGAYFEYRYKIHGSPSEPPSIAAGVSDPSGWTTEMPSVGALEYLWMTVSKKSAAGALLQNWSTPVRTSGVAGEKGDKGDSPALVYRGEYSGTETYYGTPARVDCVKYGDYYYVAQVNAGDGFNAVPTNASKWNAFGAQFESIATNLLLANMANIGGFIFKNNQLISQSGRMNNQFSTDYGDEFFVPNVQIDAINGIITVGGKIILDNDYGIALLNTHTNRIATYVIPETVGTIANLNNMSAMLPALYVHKGDWYFPTLANYHEETVTYKGVIGNLNDGDTLQISDVWFSFVVPFVNGGYITLDSALLSVAIKCGNTQAEAFNNISMSTGSIKSGEWVAGSRSSAQIVRTIGASNGYASGNYTVELSLKIKAQAYGGSLARNFEINFYQQIFGTLEQKTVVGIDGLYTYWGTDQYFFISHKEGIQMRIGNNGFRLTAENGLQKMINGNSWTTL